MNKLLKDAIADAKAVRETALAQAKLALEEAFAPKLQSMLSNKIKEEMEEEEPKADTSMDDEGMRMKELAGLSEKGEEDMTGDEDMDMDMDMGGEEGGEESFGGDMGGEDEMGGEDDFSDDMGGGEEDYSDESDDDLEEILRQLEEESSETEMDKEESMTSEAEETEEEPMDEEINLDELIQALREGEDEDGKKDEMDEAAGDEDYKKAPDQAMDATKGSHGDVVEAKKKMKKMEEELNEAYSAVKFLREKLSEVNLLNAKLLYVNKLFRKNGLSETQKVKIIETFDRAKNVREAKLIYATLSESFTGSTKTKKPVVENFASAPVKKTKVIAEGNEQMNRFKTLAGIIKS
jgi:hypothetical protein